MTDDISITMNVSDLAKLAKKLDLVDAYKDGVKASGIYVKGVISEYPQSSEANSPKPYPGRWYERGYGSKWYNKEGVLQSKKTSETLGKRWTTRPIDNGMGVEIGNNASYAVYVHSKRKQAAFHRRRLWNNDADVIEQESDKVTEIISDFIAAKLEERSKPRNRT